MKSFFSNGKILLLSFLFGLLSVPGISQQTLTKINGLNAYVHLPDDYDQTNKKYPVIIFFPGAGEIGKNEKKLLDYGPSKYIDDGHNMQFMVNGVLEKPIVISIQPIDAFPPPHYLDAIFNTVMSTWRIDPKRFHVTGISMGGFCGDNYVTQSEAYASRITSIVAMSAVIPNNPISNFKYYALQGGKWWGFEGTFDYRFMDKIRDVMNETVPGSARYTSYVGGHNGWNKWYNPEWREDGVNIYEWMLQQTKTADDNDINQWPVANAGSDQTISLPVNSLTLNGGASSDPDGNIIAYYWEKISGPPHYTLGTNNTVSTTVTDLKQGTYVFELTVTDNKGSTSKDQVSITVLPRNNQAPVANAGADLSITLPATQVTLSGSGSDADGTVNEFSWKQTVGPVSSVIQTPARASTLVNALTAPGLYEFALTVTDNDGATGVSTVKVTVIAAAPPPNQPPVADAGADITVTLPVSEAVLHGSGSDVDGSVVSFAWKQLSGPSASVVVNAANASTGVNALVVSGVYEYQLTVTDNQGATASSVTKVTVLAAVPIPNKPPVADAGADLSITLPANQVTLSGSGSDPDGTITEYQWKQQSGPSASIIVSPSNAATAVHALTQAGLYEFVLTVKDNSGATATSLVKVTVNAAAPLPPNKAPVANAGSDINITLPASGVSLAGSGVDADGSVDKYNWTQQGGPVSGVIAGAASALATVTGLNVAGEYAFMLTVTDNEGATGTASVKVTVHAAAATVNHAPAAYAGPDITISLPVNSVTLSGRGQDSDGFIDNFSWVKTQGSKKINIVNPGSAITLIDGMEQGVYELVLTVTDNQGLKASDTVVITVNGVSPIARATKTASNFSGSFSAYPNPVSDILNIRYVSSKNGALKLTIYQNNGVIAFTRNYEKQAETFIQSISVPNLLTGIYVAELRFADGEAYQVQVMKQ